MSWNNRYTRVYEAQELLDLQVVALQKSVPSSLRIRNAKKQRILSDIDVRGIQKAIWYVVQRGYARSSAAAVVGRQYGLPKSLIIAGLDTVFPPNYFKNIEQAKFKHSLTAGDAEAPQEKQNEI